MERLKNKKIISIIIVAILIFISSIILYGKNEDKVFVDNYMDDIFVDTNEEVVFSNTDTVENILTNKDEKIDIPIIFVEIKGEVLKPDVYELQEGSIVKDLIEEAGGLTEEADISNINRAKKLQNHELIVIHNINDKDTAPVLNEIVIESNGLININLADINELQKITGIGQVKAESIIEYREKNGGFKSIDEVKNVDGIGEKTFEKIKEKITL